MKTQTKILSSAFVVLILAVSLFIWNGLALGKITKNEVATVGGFQTFQFFASSTAQINYSTTTPTTATSTSNAITTWFDSNGTYVNGAFVIRGAKKVTMYFSRDDATPATGTTTFMVDVSPDGVSWTSFAKMITNDQNSNSQTLTRVQSIVITPVSTGFASSATTTVALDLSNDAIYAIRCLTGNLVDGNAYCSASASW